MKIKNIRYGHANNSSSTHSIVFLGDNHTKAQDDSDGHDYGWDHFTLSSRKAKEAYLLIVLFNNISGSEINRATSLRTIVEKTKKYKNYGYADKTETLAWEKQLETKHREFEAKDSTVTHAHCVKLLKENFSDVFIKTNLEEELEEILKGHIDHQSYIDLPFDKFKQINFDFVKQIFNLILKNNFAIFGGNDNGGDLEDHPYHGLIKKSKVSIQVEKIMNLIGYGGNVFVYDDLNNDFVVQSKTSGNKVRFSFKDKSKETTKSKFPELIDLKITSYCAFGCKFCYMSSTKDGKHADYEYLKNVVDVLFNSDVLEIAIGGGEPTTYPYFASLLRYIKSKNMLVGFTTKNYDLPDHKNIKDILHNTHSIAFSCQTEQEVQKVHNTYEKLVNNRNSYIGGSFPEFYIQVIPELFSTENFKKIVAKCQEYRFKLTLLGYKDFGFGKTYSPKNLNMSSEWIDVIKNSRITAGVDSIIVKKWKDKLIEKGCDKLMLVGEEGKFSCYIDGVEGKIAKSSFVDEQEILDLSKGNVLEQFSKF